MTNPDAVALILGPYGVVIVLLIVTRHLYLDNKALRDEATTLLKKYQDRDNEERLMRLEEEKRREEAQRKRDETEWLAKSNSLNRGDRP